MPTRSGERGASAVEFALVAPLLFLLVFGIIDLGLALSADLTVSNAAREGVRHAAVDPDPAQVESVVRDATRHLNQSKVTVVIGCTTSGGGACPGGLSGGSSGDKATVEVTYTYDLVTPLNLVTGRTLRLSTTTAMRVE